MKITIITSCTGQKKYHPEDQLQRSDFEQLHQPEVFRQLEARLKDYQTPAQDLYAGQQHLRLMEGWRHLDTQDQANLNLWIVSAGYGCIRDDRKIVPYELTFQGMKAKDLQKWSEHLSIPTDFRKIIAEPAELILVLLGEPYLRALALDDDVLFHSPTLFLLVKVAKKLSKEVDDIKLFYCLTRKPIPTVWQSAEAEIR